MSYEEFRNLAQGIQAIFITIGALIASGWALYTFRSLLSVKKARADLEKINYEIKKNKFELVKVQKEMEFTPMLEMSIEPTLFEDKTDEKHYIKIKLSIQNTGNQFEYVNWKKSSVKAAKVTSINDGKMEHSNSITGVVSRVDSTPNGIALWPREKVQEDYLIPIKQSGIYSIDISLNVSKKSTDKLVASIDENIMGSWSYGSGTFFEVNF